MRKIKLETERLILSEFSNSDEKLIFDLNSDPEVVQYTGDASLSTLNDAQSLLTTVILPQYADGIGRWAVNLKSTGEFIGWCGLKFLKELNEIDLGYRIAKKYWGSGYMTEAAKACLVYGFEVKKMEKIVARAVIENKASIRVIEKCGMIFQKETILHDAPTAVYSLTSEEYRKLKENNVIA